MDFKEKRMLEQTSRIVEENSKILKKIRRAQVTSSTVRIAYWVVILGLTFGAFYFLQPYIEQIQALYKNVQSSIDTVQSTVDGRLRGE